MRKTGTETEPINVLDDDEQQQNLQAKMEIARNNQLIEEAKLSGSGLDLCFAVVKTTIMGQLKIKQRKLNRYLIQYFQKHVQIDVSCRHFFPIPQPDYSDASTKPNLCELILYGVDFLSTNAIRQRLKIIDTQIREIYWINDSTCKIKYKNKQQAHKIIKTHMVNETKIQYVDLEEQKGWFRLQPYNLFSFQRSLYVRYATDKETDIPKSTESKYQLFDQALKMLPRSLLSQFKAEDKFRQIVSEIQRDQNLIKRHRNSFNRNRSREHRYYEDRRDRFRRRGDHDQNYNRNYFRRNRYQDQNQDQENRRKQRRQYRDRQPRDQQQNHRQKYNSRSRDKRRGVQPEHFYVTQIHKQVYEHMPTHMMKSNNAYNKAPNSKPYKQTVHFDAGQIDSNYSFNNFGSIRKPDSKFDDLDFDLDNDRSDYDFQMSNKNANQMGKSIDLSFHQNFSVNKQQRFKQQESKESYDFVQSASFLKNTSPAKNVLVEEQQDFFDIDESISQVKSKKVQQSIDVSFNLEKQMISKNKKYSRPKNIADIIDYNQDSY